MKNSFYIDEWLKLLYHFCNENFTKPVDF